MVVLRKTSYPHGFLYHPESQQILLQQNSSDPKSAWTLLESAAGGNFQQVVAKLLKLKLQTEAIHPVYDYAAKGKKHFISYAETPNLQDFPATENLSFAWFTAKQISKLCLVDQTKQDIIVGRRVIDSRVRRAAGEWTIG
jgi:hypothetical protein